MLRYRGGVGEMQAGYHKNTRQGRAEEWLCAQPGADD